MIYAFTPVLTRQHSAAFSTESGCLGVGVIMKLIKRSYAALSNIYTPILSLLSNDYRLSSMKSQQVQCRYFDVSQVLVFAPSSLKFSVYFSNCSCFSPIFALQLCPWTQLSARFLFYIIFHHPQSVAKMRIYPKPPG